MSEIVKYHNRMNEIPLIGFNEKELNILFSLIVLARDKETTELDIPFSYLRELSNDDGKNRKRFLDSVVKVNSKLIKLFYKIETDDSIIMFTLFNKFHLDLKNDVLLVQINKDFAFILNDLAENFTMFELVEFVKLKSSYSKTMYRLLKQWQSKREKTFSVEELRRLLGVPVKYNNSNFNIRVLKPINDELKTVLPDFNMKKNRKGVKIISYTFTWSAGRVDNEVIDYVEDDKKEVEISKKVIKYINYVCDHNRFIKEVLDDEENLIKLVEKFEKNQDALIKGLEYASKKLADLKKEINIEYLIKTIRTGAGVKRTKKVLKIIDDEVAVPKEVPKEQPAVEVPAEDKVEVPKVKVEETNSELAEFEKLSKEEQSKIEDIAIELYKKDNGVQANPILNMRNAKIFKNLMKKYILQAMNGEEVPTEQPAVEVPKIEEQSTEQKEQKKVYTVEDIPTDKLLSKAGKKLGGVALQARIEKILKEMNGE